MDFILGVIGLTNKIIIALMGVQYFLIVLCFFVACAVYGLFLAFCGRRVKGGRR